MFYTPIKSIALVAVLGLSACATANPGAFNKELKPVDVAGHPVHTVFAAAWMKECLGQPDDIVMMLSQFEHVHGDRYLTHIASGTVLAPGDCDKYLEFVATLGGAAILADGVRDGANQTVNNAIANQVTAVDVDIDS